MSMTGRLSTIQAAFVVARRDFVAVLFSRSFLFFLLGPLFPVLVAWMAGGIGQNVREQTGRAVVVVTMSAPDSARMIAARDSLARQLPRLPVMVSAPPDSSPGTLLAAGRADFGAVVSGSPSAPVLTGPPERIAEWRGQVAMIASAAAASSAAAYPDVRLAGVTTSGADERSGRVRTAQAGQMLMFLLTMLLAGMVMSNLVEEKANKIIEVLAAAIPMDAVFMGKLFAMLGVSLVGIATWGAVGVGIGLIDGSPLRNLPPPAVGWALFVVLGVVYFSMAYLVLGSLFLAIGGMANTVRDVQTMSMPVTMLQLLVFFFASYAMAQPGSPAELAAVIVPFSSPFAMLARAAQSPALWPHAAALAWQALCVTLFIRAGASLFRKRVMQSGPARGKADKPGLFRRRPRPA